MAIVQLAYTTTVYVEVDTETKDINSVTVDDEDITLLDKDAAAVRDEKEYFLKEVSQELYDQAVAIAENPDLDWPYWNHGF